MKKYVIVAESGADLSKELIEKYNIKIAPMHIEMEGTDYLDGQLSIEEMDSYYQRTKKVPHTAGASPYHYEQIFTEIKKENPEAIVLHLCYSAQLSVCFQNSLIADDKQLRIYRIDSKQVSIGQAFLVTKVAKLIEAKPDIETEELLKQIDMIVEKMRFHFVPGNLDYLKAGGRVSNAQYLGAMLFRIRPLIELLDGLMISTKKYRGLKKEIVKEMVAGFFANNNIDKETVFIGCSGATEEDVKDAMMKQVAEYGVKEILWFEAGTVITCHAGPGGVGIGGSEV